MREQQGIIRSDYETTPLEYEPAGDITQPDWTKYHVDLTETSTLPSEVQQSVPCVTV